MKIERISANKIKVTLTVEDLREWDIDIDAISYKSPATEELFWNMIKKAEAEANFYIDGSQLVVEAMPASGDGFVMIITKLDDAGTRLQRYVKARVRRNERVARRSVARTVYTPMVYRFRTLDDAMDACAAIDSRFVGQSSLYALGGDFFLTLELQTPLCGDDIRTLLVDFAEMVDNPGIQQGMLTERGDCILSTDAVALLARTGSA